MNSTPDTMKQNVARFLGIVDRTVYKWKKEQRPIIAFLYQYFSKEDIHEYIRFGKMEKLESLSSDQALSLYELQSICAVLGKVDIYVENHKVNREGFLIKLYRTVRSFCGNPEQYPDFLDNMDISSYPLMRNVIWGDSMEDVKDFFMNYLSNQEQELLFERKFQILPTLKQMRKHNAHLKD